MTKNIFTIVIVLICASQLFGQGYKKGVNNLNIGAGIGLAGISGESSLPALSLGYQFGFEDKYSVGAIVGYTASTTTVSQYEWRYSYIVVAGRAEYHFLEPKNNFDAYAGVSLGYTFVNVSVPDNLPLWGTWGETGTSYLMFGAHAGVRYAFSESLGGFAEVGYGIGLLTVGATFKL